MELADKKHCTGCGACMEKCPKQAIHFENDTEGFPSPVIDSQTCVECGICNKVCPAIHPVETQPIRKAYAAQILDRDALKDSTSGGLFTAFSREIFHRGGVVYGCVWDKEYNAITVKAENEEEIKPMRGSKYVWSWAGDSFPEIKKYLDAGRMVLFTGLPCQVAGLKKYLSREYDNLFLLDFLCSGVPSPLALKSYLKTIALDGNFENLNLKFRDKNPYGVGVHITWQGKQSKRKSEHISNPYYYSFYTRLIDRESCYHCSYGTNHRISDFTMGDYWGIVNYHKDMDISSGVSALMVNTEKGAAFLEQVKNTVQLKETKAENIARENNLSIDQVKNIPVPAKRADFFQTLREKGWKAAERKYLVYDTKRLKQWLICQIPTRYIKTIKRMMKRG